MEGWGEYLHEIFVGGALRKGWGGIECRKAVPMTIHLWESIGWLIICLIVYKTADLKNTLLSIRKSIKFDLKQNPSRPWVRTLELCMATVLFGLYAQICYYKYQSAALIWIFQPCHVITLLQGIALASGDSLGILIGICILPAHTGTLLAMIMPDTGGLDQRFELLAYWLQHMVIQSVPLYLLMRRNFTGLKYAGPFSITVGLWVLAIAHFFFYEIIDLTFNMNVEFMLCPTAGMLTIFPLLPQWIIWPSYRSILTYLVVVIAIPIPYFYIYFGRIVRAVVSPPLLPPPAAATAALKAKSA